MAHQKHNPDLEAEPSLNTDETDQQEAQPAAPSHIKQVVTTDEELKRLHNEAIEYKNKYLRLLADGENAKKRIEKERQEFARRTVESIITDFLHPIDSLESALNFAREMSEEVSNWALGFKMILAQLKDVLVNHGVVAIQAKGARFDPHLHEAIEMVETDAYPPGTIVEEYVRGYRMGDRTIRPSRVKVAKSKTEIEDSKNCSDEHLNQECAE